MNNSPQATIEKKGMRVDFYWLGDRFVHTVSLVRDNRAQVVWRTVDDAEHGPVYQELHEQPTDDGGKILFLSGAGGGAHWSMSVEQDGKGIAFDVAARVTAEPTERAIEYRGEFEGSAPIACGHPVGFGSSQTEESPPLVRFHSNTPDDKLPTTLRFKYAFL